jgi:hypothetical protein
MGKNPDPGSRINIRISNTASEREKSYLKNLIFIHKEGHTLKKCSVLIIKKYLLDFSGFS